MTHHTSDTDCPACAEKLKTAHLVLQAWFKVRVKKMFPDAHISWAYRGKEDQEKAFSEKRSRLHYPNSAHNHVDEDGKPQARALDLFQIDPAHPAITIYNPKFYFTLAEMNKVIGYPLIWGGDWPRFKDMVHFEMVEDGPEAA